MADELEPKHVLKGATGGDVWGEGSPRGGGDGERVTQHVDLVATGRLSTMAPGCTGGTKRCRAGELGGCETLLGFERV